ncbi:hypothetical protein ACVBEF_10380 [Glaciimonas sp. GG7]
MPFTNAPEPSPDNNLNNIKQRYFLLDLATLLADARALAIGDTGCKALQKLALLSARLLGNYAVQEVELINARKQT